MAILKSEILLEIARSTLERGEEDTAKEMVVLAMQTEDAVDALNKLLPKVPEPVQEEELHLSENQIAKIHALARDLESSHKLRVANLILGRLEKIESAKKLKRAKKSLATPEKYSHIDFSPPSGVKTAAQRGLDWRKKYGRGGTAVGIARARDLAGGKKISPSTAKRMYKFFLRHEKNKDNVLDNGQPSNGKIAWALWGGDPGQSWANKLWKQMKAADEKAKK